MGRRHKLTVSTDYAGLKPRLPAQPSTNLALPQLMQAHHRRAYNLFSNSMFKLPGQIGSLACYLESGCQILKLVRQNDS